MRALRGWVLVACVAACSDPPPIPTPFDGGFLVGDGAPVDARAPRDAEPGVELPGPERPAPDALTQRDAPAEDAEFAPDLPPSTDAGLPGCAVPPPTRTLSSSVAATLAAGLPGELVAVRGRLVLPTCPAVSCPIDTPCCGACTLALAIDGLIPVRSSSCAPQVGCAGDVCGVTCVPAIPTVDERYVGVLEPGPALRLLGVEISR